MIANVYCSIPTEEYKPTQCRAIVKFAACTDVKDLLKALLVVQNRSKKDNCSR